MTTAPEGDRIFRMTVRGRFAGLTDAQRAQLLARADKHDLVSTGQFTEEGTVTYHRDLAWFTFRFELSASGEDAKGDAAVDGELRAIGRLDEVGWGHRDVRVSVSAVPDPRPRRRR